MTAYEPLDLTDPFSPRHHNVDIDSVREFAAQRELPLCQQQRRDESGQFVSHRDLPAKVAGSR